MSKRCENCGKTSPALTGTMVKNPRLPAKIVMACQSCFRKLSKKKG